MESRRKMVSTSVLIWSWLAFVVLVLGLCVGGMALQARVNRLENDLALATVEADENAKAELLAQAYALYMAGNYKDAEICCSQLSLDHPKYKEKQVVQLALACAAGKREHEGATLFEEADAHFEAGEYAEAKEIYRKLRDQYPEHRRIEVRDRIIACEKREARLADRGDPDSERTLKIKRKYDSD